MDLKLCSRCKKRVAVVFVTRIEGDKSFNEGLCITCAKELGIKPISDIIEKMGVSEDELEAMAGELSGGLPDMVDQKDGDDDEGRAPAIDIRNLFRGMPQPNVDGEKGETGSKKQEKKQEKYKFLDAYCINLTERARNGKLDNIVGRDSELERVMQILCRRQKNSSARRRRFSSCVRSRRACQN